MLSFVCDLLYRRRQGLVTATGITGGVYSVGSYIFNRLEEVKEKVLCERAARENLRKRFEQNQHDCNFTVLALLPTLGHHVLEDMDVEAISLALQQYHSGSSLKTEERSLPIASSRQSMISPDLPSLLDQGGGNAVVSDNDFGTIRDSSKLYEPPTGPLHDILPQVERPRTDSLSDSIVSISTSESETGSLGVLQPSTRWDGWHSMSKAELWQELKILSFTRTLTILYSVTLLSIQTHIQLNLIGRYKYVQSVLSLDKEENLQERLTFQASIGSLFWSEEGLLPEPSSFTPLVQKEADFSQDIERQFLTMSWWFVNVGYRQVAERVRDAVEDVFAGVSLKTPLGINDVERLLSEVRLRVECRSQSNNEHFSFLPVLLPRTAEQQREVFIQGGLPPHLVSTGPELEALLNETGSFIDSVDFNHVLSLLLDRMTSVLLDGLKNNVYSDGLDMPAGESEKIRLASLLPGIARWSHIALHTLPNELIDNLSDSRELAALSAIVFTSYDEMLLF